jgi:hypothetical protein
LGRQFHNLSRLVGLLLISSNPKTLGRRLLGVQPRTVRQSLNSHSALRVHNKGSPRKPYLYSFRLVGTHISILSDYYTLVKWRGIVFRGWVFGVGGAAPHGFGGEAPQGFWFWVYGFTVFSRANAPDWLGRARCGRDYAVRM